MKEVLTHIDPVELTSKLVSIPSLSGHEGDIADFIKRQMIEFGFDEVSIDKNGSVLGMVGPKNAPLALLFDAHMDVVPPVGEWSFDPYSGEVRNDRLWGRGSTDMKGGLAAALCAVAKIAKSNSLDKRIAVSASVMEEVIEGHALSTVLDNCNTEAVVICEPSKLKIKVGQKGRMELLLTLTGCTSHAALKTNFVNPILSAATALNALKELELPKDEILGEAIIVPTDIISDPYPSISLTPSAVSIRFDRRTLANESEEVVIQQIDKCLRNHGLDNFLIQISGAEISTYTGKKSEPKRHLPAWVLPQDSPLLQAMISAVGMSGLSTDLSAWPFCTNGSESAGRRSIPTIGLGPGNEEDAHTIDESIEIHQVLKAEEIYINLCEKLALFN